MINGKELMIGDYVDVNDNDDIVVLGVVKEIRDEGEQLTVSINGDNVFDVCADEDVFPITLTKEFFLQNGFRELHIFDELHINETFSWLCNVDIRVAVKNIHGNCFRCEVNEIKIKYVHEFQHLMRLRGLSDYANKLKIE